MNWFFKKCSSSICSPILRYSELGIQYMSFWRIQLILEQICSLKPKIHVNLTYKTHSSHLSNNQIIYSALKTNLIVKFYWHFMFTDCGYSILIMVIWIIYNSHSNSNPEKEVKLLVLSKPKPLMGYSIAFKGSRIILFPWCPIVWA